jgi:AbrB family looped-hinge helix DNA binding protein
LKHPADTPNLLETGYFSAPSGVVICAYASIDCPTGADYSVGWYVRSVRQLSVAHTSHIGNTNPNTVALITNIWYTISKIDILEEVSMHTATVSSKGWVVIPKPLREKYGIEKGMRVQVVDCGDVLALVPLPSDPAEALHGMLKGGSSLTEELLAERARERHREESRRG